MLHFKTASHADSKFIGGVHNMTEVYAFPLPDDLEVVNGSCHEVCVEE